MITTLVDVLRGGNGLGSSLAAVAAKTSATGAPEIRTPQWQNTPETL